MRDPVWQQIRCNVMGMPKSSRVYHSNVIVAGLWRVSGPRGFRHTLSLAWSPWLLVPPRVGETGQCAARRSRLSKEDPAISGYQREHREHQTIRASSHPSFFPPRPLLLQFSPRRLHPAVVRHVDPPFTASCSDVKMTPILYLMATTFLSLPTNSSSFALGWLPCQTFPARQEIELRGG